MSHKQAIEALDRNLQDLRGNTQTMGGMLLLLAGDFRRTLPIIQRGTRVDQVNACLKPSVLWKQVQKVTPRTNMLLHLRGGHGADKFVKLLLEIGNGKTEPDDCDGLITLPKNLVIVMKSEKCLIESVFPHVAETHSDYLWLSKRAVLAPRNDVVRNLDHLLLDRVPEEVF